MTYYCLYQVTNLVNGKIYIGIHKTTNLNDSYIGSGKLIKAAIKKYGIAHFKKEILETFATEQEMIDREIQLVTEEFCERKDTYNVMPGGKFGSAKRNGLSFKGRKHSNSAIDAIKKAAIGRVASDATKLKQSENNFARRDPERQRAHAKLAASKPKSSDHKEKIRATALGNRSGCKNKGKTKPIVECPHCAQVGGVNAMARWHFDNCKKKNSPVA